jgi:hypothetical protein
MHEEAIVEPIVDMQEETVVVVQEEDAIFGPIVVV